MTAGSARSIWSYLELRGCLKSRFQKEIVFFLYMFPSILRFFIKYKPPRALGALKTASSCLTLYIWCYRTFLEKTVSGGKIPKPVGHKMSLSRPKTITFVIAFPIFSSNIGGLQPQASHCNVPWMVARIWPGDIFFEKVLIIQNPSERAAPRLGRRHYGGKTLLQLFRICKS